MKNLKKLISVVLTVAMVISSIAVVVAKDFGDVDTSAAYYEAVDVLSDLEILEGDEQGNFNADAEIKRSEFAAVVCRAMGQDNAASGSKGATMFTDVSADHWASGYINWAAQLGIVNGKGNGIFDPDAPVKYEEAIKMLVAALGYEPLAARKGGYPTGYLVVAASNGITAGVNLAGTANAPRSAVAVLVYNALDVPLMDANLYSLSGNDEYAIYDGTDYARKTVLSDYLEITKVKAVITDNARSNSNLAKKAGKQVKMELKNAYDFAWSKILDGAYDEDDIMTLYEGESGASEYLGATVVAYIAEDDGDYVLKSVVLDTTSVETVEITAGFEDVVYDASNGVIEYYENEDDLRTTELDLESSIDVYVNGVKQSDEAGWLNAIATDAGIANVTLMANKGEDFSKIFITSYIYTLVTEVELEDAIIYTDMIGDIDLGDTREDYFSYTMVLEDGTPIDIEDLEENDVLNIVCDPIAASDINDKDIVEMDIIVSRSTVEGTVDEDLGDGEYVINGEEYKNYGAKLSVGDVARFFLTVDGKLYDVDNTWEGEEGASGNYGFITAVGKTTSFGEDTYEVKMFTMDGSIATYVVAEKLYVYTLDNGEYKKSAAIERDAQDAYFDPNTDDDGSDDGRIYKAVYGPTDADEAIASIPERFVEYKLNSSDEIKEIRFAEGNRNDNEFNYIVGAATGYKEATEKFAGKTFNSKSILFYAEPEADGTFEESALEILPFSALDEDENYGTPFLFDMDRDNEIGVAVVTEGVAASKKSALAVVTAISTASNDQTKITFYQNGESLAYLVSEDCDDLDGLAVGDVFQYTLSGDEIIKGFKVADYNKTTKAISLTTAAENTTGVITYVAGEVDEKETKYIVVDGTDYSFASSDAVGTVAVYNTARSGKNAISALSSLSGLKKSGSTYTYNVILRLDDGDIVDAIEYQTATVVATDAPATDAPATDAPATDAPSAAPTAEPTAAPTAEPTAAPTAEPTAAPTAEPTAAPTAEPTVAP